MKLRYLFCLILVCLVGPMGCAWFHVSERKNAAISSVIDNPNTQEFDLPAGAKLLLVPFSAGPLVEATDELDKVTLTIIKGISEAVDESGKPLKLMEDRNQGPDFMLKGHVVEMKESSAGIGSLWGSPRRKLLGIEANLIDAKTERMICHFSDRKGQARPGITFRALGLELGRALGQSLASKIKH